MGVTNPYATKVLDKIVHERLVANIDSFAADAGIHPRWIWTSTKGKLDDVEIDWAKAIRQHMADGSSLGLCYVGVDGVLERMSLMAGWFTRNFVRARVSTVSTVLDGLSYDDEDLRQISCLLIPNLHTSRRSAGRLLPSQMTALQDLLVDRAALGLQTVIGIADPQGFANDFGAEVSRLVNDHYVMQHL